MVLIVDFAASIALSGMIFQSVVYEPLDTSVVLLSETPDIVEQVFLPAENLKQMIKVVVVGMVPEI